MDHSSLLMLNDYCLMQIFKFLDYVNLAKTCDRLQDIANRSRVHKFKRIEISVVSISPIERETKGEEFADILSVIGRHILSFQIFNGNGFIIDQIRDKCRNVNSLELVYFGESPQSHNFGNLKELKICGQCLTIDALKNIFQNNHDIEYHYVDENLSNRYNYYRK